MKIVNKYIFRQTLVGFLTILISLTILIWLTQSLRMIDMIVTKGVSVLVFLKMTLLILPNFLQILSPLALFGVALFVFIRMQSDKELIVLKAVGMSSRQLIRPLLTLGSVLVLFGYILTVWLIPYSYSQMRQMRWTIQNDLSHLLLQEGQFSSFKNGTTLYIREREGAGKVHGILAYEIKADKKSVLIAKDGSMIQTPEGISLTFNNGTRQEFIPSTHQFSILKFGTYTMLFGDKPGKTSRKLDPREMTLTQLLDATPETVTDPPTYRKYKVEAFKRLTQPLYNLLFLWIAAYGVLSGFYNRRGQSRRVNIAIATTLLLQSLALAFENIAVRNLWGLLLMGANLFIPLIILYLILFKEHKISWLRTISLFIITLCSVHALAMPKIQINDLKTKDPINFEADNVAYNLKTNTVTATGNVTLEQNGIKMQTDRVLYDKTNDIITIPEQTKLTLPDGTTSSVQNMTLLPKKSEAEANMMTGHFTDGSYLTAKQMTSTEHGDIITMSHATYTPCNICQGEAPLWQLSANEVKQDFTDHTLSYKHMFLDIKDVPILYFPYFQMPDPTIKRKSGFLNPSIRHNHEMGLSVQTPFFVNLTDNQNLLFTPIISASHLPLGVIDYNGHFTQGILNFQASGTQDNNHVKEGHIKTDFRYDPTDHITLTGQYFRTINDTYFRRYNIEGIDESQPFLTSHLTGQYFGTRFYTKAKIWHFQSLVDGVDSKSLPIIIPTVDGFYQTKNLFDTNLTAITKINGSMYNTRQHFKSNRLSLTQALHLPYTAPFGLVTQTTASARLDGYALDSGADDLVSKKQHDTYNKGRFYTFVASKVSYPLVAHTENTTQVLEPIAMLIVSPNSRNSADIPNVDSTIFNFDDTNLFSENRFAGYDRVETGSRINYGLQWTAYHNHAQNRSLSFLFGQVFRLHDTKEMNDVMGYNKHLSDYVGRIQMNYQYLSLGYRFRLDQNNFSKRKNDVEFSVGSAPLRLSINYLYQKAYTLDNKYYDSENEITFSATSQLTKNWQTSGYYRYDLKKNGGPIEYGAQLRYDNECTAIVFNVDKSYTRDRNYKGSTSFMVKVFLKTLGGIEQ